MTQNNQAINKRSIEQQAIEKQRRRRKSKKRREIFLNWLTFVIIGFFALVFLMPTVLTITNSFMSTTEISANYGQIFSNATSDSKTFISEKVNLKFIPDMVSFGQYKTAFITSPAYLLKFWNSVILTVPIVIGQIIVAAGASYCFARNRSKLSNAIFFIYIILMLMPYQVTLVPNYLVAEWLHLLDTRWSIILPGIFAPFSVFILAKFMRRIPTAVVEAAKLDGANEFRSSRGYSCRSAKARYIRSRYSYSSIIGTWSSSRSSCCRIARCIRSRYFCQKSTPATRDSRSRSPLYI